MFIKTFNFVNTDKPCRKKAKASENTFRFVDYETNVTFVIFHKMVFLIKRSIS